MERTCISLRIRMAFMAIKRTNAPFLLFLLILILGACTPTPMKAGKPIREATIEDSTFITADNHSLPLRVWPAKPNPVRAVVVALHGFNDYSNAFTELGEYLAAHHHVTTYAYDQRGFGGAGKRGTWAGDDTYVSDLRTFCHLVRLRHPGVPVYVLGESMGGAIAMVAFTSEHPPEADGVILSAPAVWSRPTMPWYQRLALFLGARLIPWASFTGEGIDVTPSDNRDMLIALGRDPQVIKATKVGAMYGLTNLMDAAMGSADKFNAESLILIGDRDEIVPNHASAVMLEHLPFSARSQQTVAVYPNGYHMLWRDLDGQVVMDDIGAWIENHHDSLPSGEDKIDLSTWVQDNLP